MNEPNTLDEQIDRIVLDIRKAESGMRDALGQAQSGIVEHHLNKIESAKQQLKTLFTEHSKEVDRLARIDEVEKIPYWGTPYDTDVYGYEKLFMDNRIAQLKRNKGEHNE